MNLLLGIGNTLLGDDGIGCYVAAHLDAEGWTSIDCGTAPENFTGVVRRKAPRLLILVDAAELGLLPGDIRRIPRDLIGSVGFGTHQLPLGHLIDFLSYAAEEIELIGVQPLQREPGERLSEAAQEGADALIEIIKRGTISRIPTHKIKM